MQMLTASLLPWERPHPAYLGELDLLWANRTDILPG